mgnify:FL=1
MSVWSTLFGAETITVAEPVETVDAHGAPRRTYPAAASRRIDGVDVQAGPTGEDNSHREGESWDQVAYVDSAAVASLTKHARIEWRGQAYRLVGPVRIMTGAGLTPDAAVLNLRRWEG